ncbi:conserved hypothetical protein [Gloeothece citriformis PCC 7424]|uniref:Uncharacterized protein n=1 Tax=Gloeothece citriformis (strain PCC 7424) TaxID=65393 RepID=B7KD84_GLOC7|nr:hypothetical protein [Gloeothece citriformis]ACK68904.1 conserved hypothetical protein [Gloeothece citriformis PCC 7424]
MKQPKNHQPHLQSFLYPKHHYRGKWTANTFLFNANLQEFSQKINYLSNLVANGKLSPEDAYQSIENLYQQLELSKQNLEL